VLRVNKSALGLTGFAITFLIVPLLQAQQPKDTAPVPSQITAGKKVFISNAGQDDLGGFSGDPDRTYNQFYSAIKTWGHYELVSTPADADLVFEVSFGVQSVGASVVKGDTVGTGYAPSFRLLILDPKTHFTLWAFTQHINWARLTANRDKDFDRGVADLITNVKKLAGDPPAAVQAAAN